MAADGGSGSIPVDIQAVLQAFEDRAGVMGMKCIIAMLHVSPRKYILKVSAGLRDIVSVDAPTLAEAITLANDKLDEQDPRLLAATLGCERL